MKLKLTEDCPELKLKTGAKISFSNNGMDVSLYNADIFELVAELEGDETSIEINAFVKDRYSKFKRVTIWAG